MNKLLEERHEKDKLYKIVCDLSGEDIKGKSREREVVYARMVFVMILIDEGHKPRSITDYLEVDRGVFYHYKKTFYDVLKQSSYMRSVYRGTKKEFYNGNKHQKTENSSKYIQFLEKEVNEYKLNNKKLQMAIEELEERMKYDIDIERFYDTFKAISTNVKKGREEILSKKIHNTINTVNSSLIY